MLTEFPVIHTNIWDAIWAIPVIVVAIILIKVFLKVPSSWLSTVAVIIGLAISIFISHSGNLSAGIFMGFFYGGAAIGSIYSMKASFRAYREG
ncbi:holin [Sporosarcina sp. 6E9]|uniref:holin n=1 Tax=Sporosarcina sp. 6E9 TaxID=2819235 RepID=UPI001B301264|nr:holin [Sporosarcina sp. 6E9]